MKLKDYVWPVVGIAAVILSAWLLYHELRSLSLDDVLESLAAIPLHSWFLALAATVVAYAALAGYDRIALMHLRRHVPWPFVALCSFTTYALAHNIGASVLSGAVVRYRAYSSRGLSGAEVGVLVALCSFTFGLGAALLAGIVLLIEPGLAARFVEGVPDSVGRALGAVLLAGVALYALGSSLGFRPVSLWGFQIHYPRMGIVARQFVVGPLELIGAAGIIYFALPEAGNPGFIVILGLFLASFCAALLSHAPGGLGVLELLFITALPDMDPADVLAALIVFRLLYLLIPFAVSIVIVLAFERTEFSRRRKLAGPSGAGPANGAPPPSG